MAVGSGSGCRSRAATDGRHVRGGRRAPSILFYCICTNRSTMEPPTQDLCCLGSGKLLTVPQLTSGHGLRGAECDPGPANRRRRVQGQRGTSLRAWRDVRPLTKPWHLRSPEARRFEEVAASFQELQKTQSESKEARGLSWGRKRYSYRECCL